jgi:hypothetical protein
MDMGSPGRRNLTHPLIPSLMLAAMAFAAGACESAAIAPYATAAGPDLAGPGSALTESAPPALGTEASPTPSDFCGLKSPVALIADLKIALSTEDAALLGSLIDPVQGMDVRLIRNGPIVNYDRSQAIGLFTSDSPVDWGQSPGSGLATIGSFRTQVVPALLDVLSRSYSLACDRLLLGGATYSPMWPYAPSHFYSSYYPGTEANGGLDWRTWLFGMRIVEARPYLFAMLQLRWEP